MHVESSECKKEEEEEEEEEEKVSLFLLTENLSTYCRLSRPLPLFLGGCWCCSLHSSVVSAPAAATPRASAAAHELIVVCFTELKLSCKQTQ